MNYRPESSAPLEGGCLCGAVRYRAACAPVRGVICHCGMCRRHSGAPALAFFHFPKTSFVWLTAEPRRYRSSRYAERGFCAECGSVLTMDEEVLGDYVQVTAGSLDRPQDVRPDDHVWVCSQLSWLELTDDLPRYERGSPASPAAPSAD